MIKKSTQKNKKYMILYKNKWIHFGDKRYQHYRDSTGLGIYSHLDHMDKERRRKYLLRSKAIKNKKGQLTWNDKSSSNYYSIKYLW